MPTVGIKKVLLDKHFGRVYTEKEFDELCFEYGLELDEITSEKAAVEKERGEAAAGEDLNDQEVYKIDIPANRYDLLSVEGLSRAIRIFKQEIESPEYRFSDTKTRQKIIVKRETAQVRPYVVGAVLRDVSFDADSYASFIDLQDKLHQNICRKRTLVAIGTHDLDTIQGPFEYRAEAPNKIKFRPLNQTKEYTAEELMTLYSTDSHLKAYLPIIQNHPVYPVIYDKNGVVCSMPPIINGEHSKITLKTKNVFIEATATDKQKAYVVLDTIVTLFSQYCQKPFHVEQVEVEYEETGEKELYPLLSYREMTVTTPEINTKIGLSLKDESLTLYSTDKNMKDTIKTFKKKIINGAHSEITQKTKNVFIEATATDKQKAYVVLDTIVTLFSQYCQKPFHVEQVEVEYEDKNEKEYFPFTCSKKMKNNTPEIRTKIVLNFKDEEMAILLNKMSLKAEVTSKGVLKVVVPPTRHDVLHACDIAEDVGVAYGYNNLVTKLSESNTVAVAFPINKLCDNLRIKLSVFGWTEALNFALCSRDDISTKLRLPDALSEAVHTLEIRRHWNSRSLGHLYFLVF